MDEHSDLVRKDARFDKLGLDPDDYRRPGEIVDLLVDHIELMQRPLIDDGKTVFIGRPPSAVEAWLDER